MKLERPSLCLAVLLLAGAALAGDVTPPGPPPVTCPAGQFAGAYPGYGQQPTCGGPLQGYSAFWQAGWSPHNGGLLSGIPQAMTLRLEAADTVAATISLFEAPSGTSCASGTNLGTAPTARQAERIVGWQGRGRKS